MVCKEDTVHVPDFTLIPVSGFVDFIARVDWRQLVGISFNTDSRVVAKRQKVVDQLKAVWARWNLQS